MKIKACLMESGNVRLCIEEMSSIYASQNEINAIIEGHHKSVIIDYHIIYVQGHQMTIMQSPSNWCNSHKESYTVKADYTIINLDTKSFFTRVKEVTAKKGIDKEVVFNTESFHRIHKNDPKANRPYLNFAAINKHEKFFGQNALKLAAKTVGRENLMKLRELINIKLADGFSVANDLWIDKPNFFFSGDNYCGGIIYHGEQHGYSTHT